MSKGKSVVMTFRVDEHLAKALERLPDRSAFIRGAIERALHEPCPACGGKGVVDCESAEWLTRLLQTSGAGVCECCDAAFPAEAAPEPVCGHCGPDDHTH